MKKQARLAGALLFLFGLTLGRSEADTPAYSITDLGQTLGDGTEIDAVAINSAGQVLLSTPDGDGLTATAYLYQNGTLQSLGLPALPGDTAGQVWGLSDAGQIAGWSQGSAAARAFLKTGGYADLGSFGGPLGASAYGVSKAGHVVGASDTGSGVAAFLYSGGVLQRLPFLPGSGNGDCGAYGVNSTDQAVGYAQSGPPDADGNTTQHAALWQNGTVRDLGSLAGPTGDSYAEAINDQAQIVGASDTADGNLDAFFLSQGVMQDLGTLGGVFSDASGINNTAQVVGEADTGQFDAGQNPITHAFLWQSGTLTDLNTAIPAASGWVLAQAVGINDAGQIVGNGQHTVSGVTYTHAFLLTPSVAHWSTGSLTVGADGYSRLLWTYPDGTAAFWLLDPAGRYVSQRQYGPFPGWAAQAVAAGPDLRTRVLWAGPGGAVALWRLDPNNGYLDQQQYGPFPGWTARSLSVGQDGYSRLLWTYPDGTAAFWLLDPAGRYVSQRQYGPFPGWAAQAVAAGPDLRTRVLWAGPGGAVALWRLDPSNGYLDQQQYGPFPGWTAQSISVGGDGNTHVLWDSVGGAAALWRLDPSNGYLDQQQYGPFEGWVSRSLVAGPDGSSRGLWECPSTGEIALWRLDARSGYVDQIHYGPF